MQQVFKRIPIVVWRIISKSKDQFAGRKAIETFESVCLFLGAHDIAACIKVYGSHYLFRYSEISADKPMLFKQAI